MVGNGLKMGLAPPERTFCRGRGPTNCRGHSRFCPLCNLHHKLQNAQTVRWKVEVPYVQHSQSQGTVQFRRTREGGFRSSFILSSSCSCPCPPPQTSQAQTHPSPATSSSSSSSSSLPFSPRPTRINFFPAFSSPSRWAVRFANEGRSNF